MARPPPQAMQATQAIIIPASSTRQIIDRIKPAFAVPPVLPFLIAMIPKISPSKAGPQTKKPTIPHTKDAMAKPLDGCCGGCGGIGGGKPPLGGGG